VPKTLDGLERVLRILLLLELLRTLRPGLSGVPLGNLEALVAGSVSVVPARLRRRRGTQLRRDTGPSLPSSEAAQDRVVERALELVVEQKPGPEEAAFLRRAGSPGTSPVIEMDLVSRLREDFLQRGFRLEEFTEPASVPTSPAKAGTIPQFLFEQVKKERTRELLCLGAFPFLAPFAFAPNPILSGGTRIIMTVCGLEIID